MNLKKLTITVDVKFTVNGKEINNAENPFLKDEFCSCNKQFESLAKQEESKQDEPKLKYGDQVQDTLSGDIGIYIGIVKHLIGASLVDINGSYDIIESKNLVLVDELKVKKEKPLGQQLYESIFDNGNAFPEWDKLSDKFKEAYQTTAEEFVTRLGE